MRRLMEQLVALPLRGAGRTQGLWERFRSTTGTQLMEFALVLPVLLLLAVGGIDFSQGFILKHKLTNAAREGARIAVQQATNDLDTSNPPTIQTVRNAVVDHLQNQAVNTSAIGTTPAKTGAVKWTYSGGGAQIIIDRGVVIPSATGSAIQSTTVTIRYPFNWSLDRVVEWLDSSSEMGSSFTISTHVTMANLF
jgi:Flp pilus assembly protein TadG